MTKLKNISEPVNYINIEKENCFQMPSFGYECFNRKLTLPSNAEYTFIQAEYRKGILNMYLPKTDTPTRQAHINVVVY